MKSTLALFLLLFVCVAQSASAAGRRPIGPRAGIDNNLDVAPDNPPPQDDEGVPTEHPICPDCAATLVVQSGLVSALDVTLLGLKDRLGADSTIVGDKLELYTNANYTTRFATFEIGGFEPAAWLASNGGTLPAANVSMTSLTTAQRDPGKWGGSGFSVRVRIDYRTATGQAKIALINVKIVRPKGTTGVKTR